MTTRWRIYCTEPGDVGWQYAWSDTQITQCPNNPAHTVNPNSVQQITLEKQANVIFPTLSSFKISTFTNAATIEYDVNAHGIIRRLNFMAELRGTSSDFAVRLVNADTSTVLYEESIMISSGDPALYTIGPMDLSMSGRFTLDIDFRRTSGVGTVDIRHLMLYAYKENDT